MTASYNISFLGSPEQAESRASKKGYRSSKYNNAGEREQSSSLELPSVSIKGEANNYMVEVVDFDNESHTFEVDARSEASPRPPQKIKSYDTRSEESGYPHSPSTGRSV